ncbi:hypothetical protein ACFXKG_08765 [Streptomyces sp. NPDC059255]|uniref:hypothetical protein n=1 Tax=Streptomyces sp. NPDC059255 TaxID=3346793 RepID=UPI00367B485C
MYEPNDVTVELDGLGRQLSELPAGTRPEARLGTGTGGETIAFRAPGLEDRAADGGGTGGADGAEAPEGPVFVDESGRRSKKLRRAGWVVAIACACYAVTVVAALVGGDSSAPWLQIPGLADKKKPDTVQIQPAPSGSPSEAATSGDPSASPTETGTGGAGPRTSETVTTGTSGNPAPGVSGSVKEPVVSNSPVDPAPDPDPPGDSDPDPGTAAGAGSAGPGGESPSAPAGDGTSQSPDPSTPVESPPGDDGGPRAVEGAQ